MQRIAEVEERLTKVSATDEDDVFRPEHAPGHTVMHRQYSGRTIFTVGEEVEEEGRDAEGYSQRRRSSAKDQPNELRDEIMKEKIATKVMSDPTITRRLSDLRARGRLLRAAVQELRDSRHARKERKRRHEVMTSAGVCGVATVGAIVFSVCLGVALRVLHYLMTS